MTEHVVSARQLASRFPGNNARYYAWCKYATDPLYAAVYTALADTKLADTTRLALYLNIGHTLDHLGQLQDRNIQRAIRYHRCGIDR